MPRPGLKSSTRARHNDRPESQITITSGTQLRPDSPTPSASLSFISFPRHSSKDGAVCVEAPVRFCAGAISDNPLNLNALDNLAQSYGAVRQFDLMIEQSKRTMEIDQNFPNIHQTLSRAYHEQGKYDLWLQEWEKFARLSEDANELALVEAAKREYPKSGQLGAFRAAALVQERQAKQHYVDPGWIAGTFAMSGEKDKAFSYLEKACAEKSGFLLHLKDSTPFGSLRSDPRYPELLKRMGLPE